jgi:hypothetical protein
LTPVESLERLTKINPACVNTLLQIAGTPNLRIPGDIRKILQEYGLIDENGIIEETVRDALIISRGRGFY